MSHQEIATSRPRARQAATSLRRPSSPDSAMKSPFRRETEVRLYPGSHSHPVCVILAANPADQNEHQHDRPRGLFVPIARTTNLESFSAAISTDKDVDWRGCRQCRLRNQRPTKAFPDVGVRNQKRPLTARSIMADVNSPLRATSPRSRASRRRRSVGGNVRSAKSSLSMLETQVSRRIPRLTRVRPRFAVCTNRFQVCQWHIGFQPT